MSISPTKLKSAFQLDRRRLGAFYTPRSTAEYMADWVLRQDGERVLEPSFGDGNFLNALAESARRRDVTNTRLVGVEIDPKARKEALDRGLIAADNAHLGDFLSEAPFPVQAVIGNPPYVRLRNLPEKQRAASLVAARAMLSGPMDPSGSVWMPFVLHAMRFLEAGGRLAFVLPWEFTYVRYARPLWAELGRRFGSLRVLRTHQRLFPELMQDVVILLADEFGWQTDSVRFQAFELLDDLLTGNPVVDELLPVAEVVEGKRVFIQALLDRPLRDLLDGKIADLTKPARSLVRFNIGYVSGDKTFFHPSAERVREFEIPATSLRLSLTSAKMMRGLGLRTSSHSETCAERLFVPDPDALTAGEERYIIKGVNDGASNRYKCRIRDPWYVVPGLREPDVMLTVFTERPILTVNDAGYLASNSLLCGFSYRLSGDELAARWYTSLTLLQAELEVHALGGGVMVMVPVEAGNIRLPERLEAKGEHLRAIDVALRSGDIDSAYRLGDSGVLVGQLGLSPEELTLIRRGLETLAHWRTSSRTSKRLVSD